MFRLLFTLSLAVGASAQTAAQAADEPAPLLSNASGGARYITREERRDSGHRYRPANWLALAALLELEYVDEGQRYAGDEPQRHDNASGKSAEAVLEIQAGDWSQGEFVWEFDQELGAIRLDEALWTVEIASLELELGRYYLPFGEYFSHFVTGPLLEFSETRGRAAGLAWALSENLEFGAFGWLGRSRRSDGTRPQNWGLHAEYAATDTLTLGLGYLSNLADSDHRLLTDNGHRFQKQVGAANGFLIGALGPVEYTAEYVGATAAIAELPPPYDRPAALNIELALSLLPAWSMAVRWERARELAEEPERRHGLALVWQFLPAGFLTTEFLRADFANSSSDDDDDAQLRAIDTLAVQLSLGL